MTFSDRSVGDPGALDAAVACVRSGGLLVHPTTGVYGIGGLPGGGREAEVERLKGRAGGPGIVHLVFDVAAVRRSFPGAAWPTAADRLAAAFWPGPLTLVLPDGSPHGVAVRAEAHPVTRRVLEALNGALGSSSLNLSGEAPASDEASARRVLSAMPLAEVDVLLLAAGPLPGPPPSTLVRVTDDAPDRRPGWEILREGAVSAAAVREALTAPEVRS